MSFWWRWRWPLLAKCRMRRPHPRLPSETYALFSSWILLIPYPNWHYSSNCHHHDHHENSFLWPPLCVVLITICIIILFSYSRKGYFIVFCPLVNFLVVLWFKWWPFIQVLVGFYDDFITCYLLMPHICQHTNRPMSSILCDDLWKTFLLLLTDGVQSTLPKSKSHKSNKRLSRRSLQVLFSLFSIVFYIT